jgi:hypothetical protein
VAVGNARSARREEVAREMDAIRGEMGREEAKRRGDDDDEGDAERCGSGEAARRSAPAQRRCLRGCLTRARRRAARSGARRALQPRWRRRWRRHKAAVAARRGRATRLHGPLSKRRRRQR